MKPEQPAPDLIRYANSTEAAHMSKTELADRFGDITKEMTRLITESTRLQSTIEALQDEIQPYIDKMDALEEDSEAQDAYIKGLPEHVRQSIDLLDAAEEALARLKTVEKDLGLLQEAADRQYKVTIEREEQDRLNRGLPN